MSHPHALEASSSKVFSSPGGAALGTHPGQPWIPCKTHNLGWRYLVANVYKAKENHNLCFMGRLTINIYKLSIFHSYVSLPEGIYLSNIHYHSLWYHETNFNEQHQISLFHPPFASLFPQNPIWPCFFCSARPLCKGMTAWHAKYARISRSEHIELSRRFPWRAILFQRTAKGELADMSLTAGRPHCGTFFG